MLFIRVVIRKTRIEAKVGVEESTGMFVELMADKEALVKVPIVKILENMVDEFGKKNIRHPGHLSVM